MITINGQQIQFAGGSISCGDTHGAGFVGFRLNGVPIALQGQLSSGSDGYNPSPALEGEANFRVNGTPVVRSGHAYADHTRGDSVHSGRTAAPTL